MENGTIFECFGKWYVKRDGYQVKFNTREEAEQYKREKEEEGLL